MSAQARRRRDYLRSTGRPSLVTGTPVEVLQRRIRSFRARGMSLKQMESQTGVSYRTINEIEVAKGIRRSTFVRVSRLRFEPPSETALIDAAGTRRRLGSLWYDGFPLPFLQERLGLLDPRAMQTLVKGGKSKTGRHQVRGVTAAAAARLFDELDGRKPEEFGIDVRRVKYCRTFAEKRGLWPRTCWDPDTIDDPKAIPEWTGACGTPAGLRIHYRDDIPTCPACLATRESRETPGAGRLDGTGGISGARLRAVRESRGWSTKGLAHRLGMNDSTVYYWETGRSAPRDQAKVDQLITVLGCNYEDIREEG